MANSYVSYTATSGQTLFTVPFDYILSSDLEVRVAGVVRSFTELAHGQIQLSSGATTGQTVTIRRYTPITGLAAPFSNATVLRAADFNKNGKQAVLGLQDLSDRIEEVADSLEDAQIAAGSLPSVSGADNDKSFFVVSGAWATQTPAQARTILGLDDLGARSGVASGTGATSRTLATRWGDVKNVKDFGATGDGSTDDTAAIQAALDAAPSRGVVVFPAGNYVLTAALNIAKNLTIEGQDSQLAGNINCFLKVTATLQNLTIRGLRFQHLLGAFSTPASPQGYLALTNVSDDGTYETNITSYPTGTLIKRTIGKLLIEDCYFGPLKVLLDASANTPPTSWSADPLWVIRNNTWSGTVAPAFLIVGNNGTTLLDGNLFEVAVQNAAPDVIRFMPGSRNVRVTNNTIINTNASGTACLNLYGASLGCSVRDNTLVNVAVYRPSYETSSGAIDGRQDGIHGNAFVLEPTFSYPYGNAAVYVIGEMVSVQGNRFTLNKTSAGTDPVAVYFDAAGSAVHGTGQSQASWGFSVVGNIADFRCLDKDGATLSGGTAGGTFVSFVGDATVAFTTAGIATNGQFTGTNTFSDGQKVRVEPRVSYTVLPTGLSTGTTYFIRDSNSSGFKLAATAGGAAITFASVGTGGVNVYAYPRIGQQSVISNNNVMGNTSFLSCSNGVPYRLLVSLNTSDAYYTVGDSSTVLLGNMFEGDTGNAPIYDLTQEYGIPAFAVSTAIVTGSGSPELRGIWGGKDGQEITLVFKASVTVKHDDTSVSALTKILTDTGADRSVTDKDVLRLVYSSDRGAWLESSFSTN